MLKDNSGGMTLALEKNFTTDYTNLILVPKMDPSMHSLLILKFVP